MKTNIIFASLLTLSGIAIVNLSDPIMYFILNKSILNITVFLLYFLPAFLITLFLISGGSIVRGWSGIILLLFHSIIFIIYALLQFGFKTEGIGWLKIVGFYYIFSGICWALCIIGWHKSPAGRLLNEWENIQNQK